MYKVKINKTTFKNHMYYDWWKYLAGILATVFIWSMVSTVTRPQIPADKKIDFYMVGDYMLQDSTESISNKILEDFPELLEVNFYNIALEGEMGYAGIHKLTAMLFSQTGDIFSFNREDFKTMAEQEGIFIPLDDYIDELQEFVPKEKLEECKFKNLEEEESHYYGVPMEGITLFEKTGYDVSDKIMGVMIYSKNQEKAIEVIKWILKNGRK